MHKYSIKCTFCLILTQISNTLQKIHTLIKMNRVLLFLIMPLFSAAQVQIGQDIDGLTAGEQSGWSVSLSSDGTIMALGALTSNANGGSSGQVRILENQSGNWVQLGLNINGEGSGDQSGTSVSLSANGDILAIGAPRNDGNGNDSGHVRIFENQSGDWVQLGNDIDGAGPNNRFGTSVSLSSDGTIVAVGAPFNSSNAGASGQVRVFENQAGNWVQIGQDIFGESAGDFSGSVVTLSGNGNILAIAAARNDGNGGDSGHVRIFENQSGNWVQVGEDIDGEAAGNQSGSSLSLSDDGNRIAIGATFNNGNGNNSGHTRIFENQNGNWVQIGLDINGDNPGDLFGWSVELSSNGEILASSGPANGASRGYTKVYQEQSGNWIQIGQDIEGEATNNFSGRSVSLSSDGTELAIGANRNADNGNDSGHVRVYDLSDIVLSLADLLIESKLGLFPNPATNHTTVKFKDAINFEKVNIYNNMGQYIFSTAETSIDLSKLQAGIYFLNFEFSQGTVTKKLIKK